MKRSLLLLLFVAASACGTAEESSKVSRGVDASETPKGPNCGHCHNDKGSARTTGLWLRVPGKPDESVLIRRMRSTEPQQMMPEIGRSLVHEEGVAVVSEWIASLTGECR